MLLKSDTVDEELESEVLVVSDSRIGESGKNSFVAFVEREDAERCENIGDESTKLVRIGVESVGDIGDEIRVRNDLTETDLWEAMYTSEESKSHQYESRLTSVFINTRKHLSISD